MQSSLDKLVLLIMQKISDHAISSTFLSCNAKVNCMFNLLKNTKLISDKLNEQLKQFLSDIETKFEL